MQIQRENNQWQLYILGTDGKKRPVQDIVIPPELTADEVLVFIADIYHELATPEKSEVRKL